LVLQLPLDLLLDAQHLRGSVEFCCCILGQCTLWDVSTIEWLTDNSLTQKTKKRLLCFPLFEGASTSSMIIDSSEVSIFFEDFGLIKIRDGVICIVTRNIF